MRKLVYSLAGLLGAVGLTHPAPALAETIDFDSLGRGEIVTTQFQASSGVTFFAEHYTNESANAAIIFDTLFDGPIDRDLQGPSWDLGNQSATTFGNVLILPERLDDRNNDGFVDDPNDEGKRPAGILGLVFDTPVVDFGFDLLDVELPREPGEVAFYSNGSEVVVTFAELASADASIAFGDHSANRIAPIRATDLGLVSFDEVHFRLGGSGAIDNLTFGMFIVPEPSTTFLFCVGFAALARGGRSRRSQREPLSGPPGLG